MKSHTIKAEKTGAKTPVLIFSEIPFVFQCAIYFLWHPRPVLPLLPYSPDLLRHKH